MPRMSPEGNSSACGASLEYESTVGSHQLHQPEHGGFSMTNEKCGRIIRCFDLTPRPCLRDKGHEYGCNPFSGDAPPSLDIIEVPIEIPTPELWGQA